LPKAINSLSLYESALEKSISIAPGPMFSATKKYKNCIRLNCALPWNTRLEWALMMIGELAKNQLKKE